MKFVSNYGNIPIKLWLNNIEGGAMEQALNLSNLPFAFRHIALMPDAHQGFGMPIGGVLATNRVIVPNACGSDISCGMIASRTKLEDITKEQIQEIVDNIRLVIPVGFQHQDTPQEWEGFDEAPDIYIIQKELKSAQYQLGTLGGGNHFLEIQKGNDGFVWLMMHSGSRNLGYKVADYFHQLAVGLAKRWYSNIPTPDLAFLPFDTKEGQDYWSAMNYCVKFAKANRELMMKRVKNAVCEVLDGDVVSDDSLDVTHNFIAIENHFGNNVFVHRKGATRARLGEKGIIPGSMGSKSYIVEGKGNPESFQSCSHGAGRAMSRKEAKERLNVKDEWKKLEGVVHGLRDEQNLDEAPGAYKDISVVMANQSDLVDILVELSPLGNVKG